MSTIFKNFDFNPVNTVRGSTASYTVPAGRYARVSISYDLSFSYSNGLTQSPSSAPTTTEFTDGPSIADTFDLFLPEGSIVVLAAANTNASGAGSGSDRTIYLNAVAGFTVTINGVLWRTFQTRSRAHLISYFNGFSNSTCSITANSNFGYISQEFNIYT